jgi:transposase
MRLPRLRAGGTQEDGRKLPRQAQHERRKQAVRLYQRGMSVKDIAAALGMAQGTVRSAIKVMQTGGITALKQVRSYFEDPRVSYAAEQTLVAG